MRNLLSQLLAVGPELAAFILTSSILSARRVHAITQGSVPSPNLDLSELGRVAITGDFDSVSLYAYPGQNENAFTTNGSQSLLTRYPDGAFESLAMADAYITTMCPFVQKDGTLTGVVVGGNFTSLGGVQAQAVALWNPNTTQITALPGLSGKVNSVYCDASSGTVYVGGLFTTGNSSNAMSYTSQWVDLPFAGFNGPVTSITKDAAGNIVFAGQFDGLGNTTTPQTPDAQVINLSSGTITGFGTTSTAGFTDASQIICKTGQQSDGPGNTWLLADNTAGWWQGTYSFGFIPTKMRLYNTKYEGRGTKSFYFENMDSGGILNLSYLDSNGQNKSCSSSCPLPQNNNTSQDFHFVPPVGLNSFRIYITEWYGPGGGLAGIEMFQNDIYSFAINEFNEPKCDDVSNGSNSTANPSSLWTRIPNRGMSSSDYLSASITQPSQLKPDTNVVFTPDLKQSGNYTVTVYTPGCFQDNSCMERGVVNVTGSMTTNSPPLSTTIYQTNSYDKFDQIYYGYIDIDTGSFRPSVTLSPVANQNLPLTVVAQRIRFELVTTTGGLNGLYEYNPDHPTTTDFSSSTVDSAGSGLNAGALVAAVTTYQNQVFVAGNFSGNGISNAMSIGKNATALANGGLNAPVQTVYRNGSVLYMGGNFTSTADNAVRGLNNVASFDIASSKWAPLGAGVNGTVTSLVPLPLNISSGALEDCLTVNGNFSSVYGFEGNPAFPANGFAIWAPGQKNWLHNLPSKLVINGKLTTSANVPGFSPLYAGQISSQALGFSDAVELAGSGQPSLQSLGVQLSPTQSGNGSSTVTKRALTTSQNSTGVYTGLYYYNKTANPALNVTVLGGRFSASASNGSTVRNLLFINNTNSEQSVSGVSGLNSDSTFVGMDIYESQLFAGGQITGTVNGENVNGLIVYDLAQGAYVKPQPPALGGATVIVNTIAAQPSASAVYVGGNFTTAGSLPCAGLCWYDTGAKQWNAPSTGFSGTVNDMYWSSNTVLVVAGNLTVNGNVTYIVTYDTSKQQYTLVTGAATLPGPVSVVKSDMQSGGYWAAGIASNNGSAYLAKYENDAWTGVSGLGAGSAIRGLQILPLTSNHAGTSLVSAGQVLMVLGNIVVPNFGNASAVLFNGTAFEPFLLTNKQDGSQGTASNIFVANPGSLTNAASAHHLALGLVVLVGLAIALALIFLIVVAGILVERSRRRREGYVPMALDKNGNLSRIPPASLLGQLHEKNSPPKL